MSVPSQQPGAGSAAVAAVPSDVVAIVAAAARAAAERLPTAVPLTAGTPVTDPATPVLPPGASSAVCARLGPVDGGGELVVVVADDVVRALAESPLGKLELAPALQPALDAAAACFGGVPAGPGREMEPAAALDGLHGAGGYVAVPLLADGEHRATLAVLVAPPSRSAGRSEPGAGARQRGLELLQDVEMEVTVELGRTRMTVRELLTLTPGAVVELDRAAGSPADLLVNGTLIARGEVVVVDEDFGIRITEIVAAAAGEH
jgi:flagellar motor switch protein FliN/FliY